MNRAVLLVVAAIVALSSTSALAQYKTKTYSSIGALNRASSADLWYTEQTHRTQELSRSTYEPSPSYLPSQLEAAPAAPARFDNGVFNVAIPDGYEAITLDPRAYLSIGSGQTQQAFSIFPRDPRVSLAAVCQQQRGVLLAAGAGMSVCTRLTPQGSYAMVTVGNLLVMGLTATGPTRKLALDAVALARDVAFDPAP